MHRSDGLCADSEQRRRVAMDNLLACAWITCAFFRMKDNNWRRRYIQIWQSHSRRCIVRCLLLLYSMRPDRTIMHAACATLWTRHVSLILWCNFEPESIFKYIEQLSFKWWFRWIPDDCINRCDRQDSWHKHTHHTTERWEKIADSTKPSKIPSWILFCSFGCFCCCAKDRRIIRIARKLGRWPYRAVCSPNVYFIRPLSQRKTHSRR